MIPPIVTAHSYIPAVHGCRGPARSNPRPSSLLLISLAFLVIAGMAAAQAQQPNVWAWVSGSNTVAGAAPGVYGTQGTAAPANMPGARQNAGLWADAAGNVWLFGGLGNDAHSTVGYLNDLWMYDTSAQQWTWVTGGSVVSGTGGGGPGVYGTLGQPAAANTPGGRTQAAAWSDSAGNLWLFGGLGYDAQGTLGSLNDLWTFNITTRQWTWYGGSNTVPSASGGVPGVYGTLGAPAAQNFPGGRSRSTFCRGADGRLWLFGGSGTDAAGRYSDYLNDLWALDPSSRQWTWMGGSSTLPASGGLYGVYGTLGTADAQNVPGGRFDASCWIGRDGSLWLYGGLGYLSDKGAYANDLWRFTPSSLEWTWMGGSQTTSNHDTDGNETHNFVGQPGVYGSLGVASQHNIPGARRHPVAWADWNGNLWLYGGAGFDSSGHFGLLNDLWAFSPANAQWTWMGGDATIPKAPDCSSTDFYTDPCGRAGSYGLPGAANSENHPGSRTDAAGATDPQSQFWLFSGNGFDSVGRDGGLNDLWRFRPAASLQAAPPTLSPAGGDYATSIKVALADATAGATIYYTTDGSAPTTKSSVYSSPICVCPNPSQPLDQPVYMTIEAIAIADGYSQSQVSWALYRANLGPPDRPVLNPAPGAYSPSVDVTITDDSSGAKIYYNLGGSPPNANSTPYTGPIHITSDTTVQAVACNAAGCSSVIGGEYDIAGPPAALPTFNPPAGPYTSIQSVAISDSTPGATIYYTIDGTLPTVNSTPYSAPITVAASQTIEAIAFASGYSASPVASAQYTLNLPPPSYSLGASASTLTISHGGQGTLTLTVTPQNGFNGAVTFACSGLPPGVTCSFNPASIPGSGKPATTELTILASTSASNRPPASDPLLPGAALALAGCCFFIWRRRSGSSRIGALFLCAALFMISACGGSAPRAPTTATVTISATSGSLQQTMTVALTITH